MLLGIFLKVCQAYHSHLRAVTSLPERAAAAQQETTQDRKDIIIETFSRSSRSNTRRGGKSSTENVEPQHPEDPFTGAVLTQQDLDSYFFPGLTTARRTFLFFF